jgi:ATP-dependent RNA helicase SUPV3L1/SUV3
MPELPRAGLTSVAAIAGIPDAFYRVAGFHVCGPRAVRIDMLERLADLIRPMLAWRGHAGDPTAPKGATGDGGFRTTPEMMSILGCPADELGHVLKALGFWVQRRPLAPAREPPTAVEPALPQEADAASPGQPAGDGAEAQPADLAIGDTTGRWEEVWRPRRKGHAAARPQRARSQRSPANSALAVKPTPRRDGSKPRRESGKPRPAIKSQPASAARPFDPDSPFAALSTLKAALEKRGQE